jgi:hypothetical protein
MEQSPFCEESQMIPVHTFPPYFHKIHFNIIFSSLYVLQVVSFLQVSQLQYCVHFSSLSSVIHALPIYLDLITLIILGKAPHHAFVSCVPQSVWIWCSCKVLHIYSMQTKIASNFVMIYTNVQDECGLLFCWKEDQHKKNISTALGNFWVSALT